MRTYSSVFFSLCLAFAAVACSGSDSDSDPDNDIVDIPSEEDPPDDESPPPPPEDPGPQPAVGIGQVCNQDNPCPEAAPICAVFAQGADGVCTAVCGTTPVPPEGEDPVPPDPQLDQTCPTYSGTGTSACVLSAPPQPGDETIEWVCGVLCGEYDTGMGIAQLGECDAGLTCGNNLCTP